MCSSDLAHLPGLPVGAGAGHTIGQQLAVARRHHAAEGHGAVLAHRIRVQRQLRGVGQRLGRVEHVLLLQAVVAAPEVAATLAERDAE